MKKIAIQRLVPAAVGTLAALTAACGTAPYGKLSKTPPKVTDVLAVDTRGTQPSSLIWSGFDVDPDNGRAPTPSPSVPAGFGGLRIEFDQLLDGSSVAGDYTIGPKSGGQFTACDPAGSSVKVFDLGPSGPGPTPAPREIGSSVCYVPNALVGTRTALLVNLGSNSIDPTQVPFTCNAFSPAPSAGLVLQPGNRYQIQLKADRLKGENGLALTLPSGGTTAGGTWDPASATLTFTAASFSAMASTFVDPVSAFNYYPSKYFPGFQKDKVAEPEHKMPADRTPLVFTMSSDVNPATLTPSPVQIVRGDGTTFPAGAYAVSSTASDRRNIVITPTSGWEPNQTYTVTLKSGVAGAGTNAGSLPSDVVTTFTTAQPTDVVAGNLDVVRLNPRAPVDGATSVAAENVVLTLTSVYPLDPATVAAAGNITLTDPNNVVIPTTATVSDLTDNQFLTISTPTPSRLAPGTLYKLSIQGLVSKAPQANINGRAIDASNTTFTTANFHKQVVGQITGAKAQTSIASSVSVDPAVLGNRSLRVVFNDVARGVVAGGTGANLNGVQIGEINGTVTTLKDPALVAVAADNAYLAGDASTGSFRAYTVKLTEPVKMGQKYQVRLNSSVVDPAGRPVTKDGCTTGDCADLTGFTTSSLSTAAVTSSTTGSPPTAASVKFKVTFNQPLDQASVDAILADHVAHGTGSGFRIFKTDPATKQVTELTDAGGKSILTCTGVAGTSPVPPPAPAPSGFVPGSFSCTPSVALSPNTPYLVTATFALSSPAKVAATLKGVAIDQTTPVAPAPGPTFVGTVSTSDFYTPCQ